MVGQRSIAGLGVPRRLRADNEQQEVTDHFLFADVARPDFAERFERGKLSFTGDVLQV